MTQWQWWYPQYPQPLNKLQDGLSTAVGTPKSHGFHHFPYETEILAYTAFLGKPKHQPV
jgi:hypothetical protein